MNATQEEHNIITVTLFSPMFGKTEVESRVNISRGRFNTLECVATVQGEQAYTLFSISGELRYHTRKLIQWDAHTYAHRSCGIKGGAGAWQSHVLLLNCYNPLLVFTFG